MAHSIIVDLLMRTGSFETDTKRAEKALARMEKQAIAAGQVVGGALVAGAAAAAYAFDTLVKSAADFKDLEEMTGAAAEDLASLAVAAGTAGVEMDTLAANSIRLTKGLTGVDDDSKAAGAAIKALGLDLKGFKQLDPVAQIDALTKAFAGFADGPEKAAVATALWGKSGAEMLKVLKALEEQGGRTKLLTQQQIDAADAYADAQAKASTELKLYAQAAATQALPAFNTLTTAAGDFIRSLFDVDAATGKLGGSTAIRDFAADAVRALAFVVDAADGVVRVFRLVGTTIGAAAAQAAAVASGEFRQALAIGREWQQQVEQILQRETFGRMVDERLASSAAPAARQADKPRLQFDGAAGAAGAEAKKAAAERLKLAEFAAEQLVKLEEITAQETAEAWSFVNKQVIDQQAARAEAAQQQWQQVFAFIDEEQERAIEAGRAFLDAEAAAKKAGSELDLFGKQLAENIQDTLGDGLYQAMTGNFKNIATDFGHMLLRMLAQAQAADLARAIFGTDAKGGLSGGWLGQLGSAFGSAIGGWFGGGSADNFNPPVDYRAAGGQVNAGQAYMVGERGPELFQPYTAGRVLPNDALGARVAPRVEVINNLGVRSEPDVQQGPDGALRIMLNAVAADTRRGGVTARATAGRFGVNNGATLNRRRG